MKLRNWPVTLCFLLVLSKVAFPLPAYITFPSDIDWVTRRSAHFDVVYRQGFDRLAERTLVAAERAHKLLSNLFPPGPDRTFIVLADFQDSTNGYALTFPYPHMVIFAAPPEPEGQLGALDSWLDSVVLHEYVHILHIFPVEGAWKVLRSIFGTIVVPNGLMPSHFHEGLAVHYETEFSDGGRGAGTVFSMYRRMAVVEGKWGLDSFAPMDRMDGTVGDYPHGASAYFFGQEMYRELNARKGRDGLKSLVSRYSSAWPYFLTGPLQAEYQTDYSTLWADIFKKTTAAANLEIEKARKTKLAEPKFLTESRFNKWDLRLSPDGKTAAYRSWTPQDGAYLEFRAVAEGGLTQRYEATGAAHGLCWLKGEANPLLLYFEVSSSRNYQLNALRALDPQTGKKLTVTGDDLPTTHLHRIDCSSDGKSVITYHEVAGIGHVHEATVSELADSVKLTGKRKWRIPEGTVVNALLATSPAWIGLRNGTSTSFLRWGEGNPVKVVDAHGNFHSFREAPKKNSLVAIADIDGRDEIWSVSLDRRRAQKWVGLLGGTDGFDFRGKDVHLLAYRHGGYDLAVAEAAPLAERDLPQVLADKSQSAPSRIKMGDAQPYSPWSTILPRAWVPQLLVVPQGMQLGLWVPGFDLSQRHYYDLYAGYDTRGLPFVDLGYVHRFGGDYSVGGNVYYLPSYIQSSRSFFKRWGTSISFGATIPGFPPSLQLAAIFRRLEPSPGFPGRQSVGLQLSMSYRIDYRRRPLSITNTRGTGFLLSHALFPKALGSTDNYYSSTATVEQYLEAPWARDHVFFATAKLGFTEGSPLYNNYFESGGELLFQQGRNAYLNRGFYPGTFLGRQLFNINFEYRFPILRLERGYKYWPFALSQIHAAIVNDWTTIDREPYAARYGNFFKRFYTSIGIELKSEWKVGFYLPAHLRVGAYHGFGPWGEDLYISFGAEASL